MKRHKINKNKHVVRLALLERETERERKREGEREKERKRERERGEKEGERLNNVVAR